MKNKKVNTLNSEGCDFSRFDLSYEKQSPCLFRNNVLEKFFIVNKKQENKQTTKGTIVSISFSKRKTCENRSFRRLDVSPFRFNYARERN